MVHLHLDPSRLSLEELANATDALRYRCADCIEHNVPEECQHGPEVKHFLNALADALDHARLSMEQREYDRALGVDTDTGEWVAGA
jgi:hypothetical protein